MADIMAPNLLELETLCGLHLATLAQTRPRLISCWKAASRWCWSSTWAVPPAWPGASRCCWRPQRGDYLIARPLYDFARQPVGWGSISALMLANLQAGSMP